MKKNIKMVGEKSPIESSFAVFESFGDWLTLKRTKVLPQGVYFAVLRPTNKTKADIFPNLFVQGYRPHSSGAQIHVDKRRYAKFVPAGQKVAADDLDGLGIKDGGMGVIGNVAADDGVFGIFEIRFQLAVGMAQESVLDVTGGHLRMQFGGQLHKRAIHNGHSRGKTVEDVGHLGDD